MSVERKLTDIPPDEVDEVVGDFESEGCTIESKTKQADGNWTVVASCPSGP